MKSDFFIALTQLAAERHLPKEEVLKAIEAALVSAFRKDHWGEGVNVSVKLNPNTGQITASVLKTVVEQVEDEKLEIVLKSAKKIDKSAVVGDILEMESVTHEASRIAAQTAKQVVLQRLREAERELVYDEFANRIDDIISGTTGQAEPGRGITLELDRAEALLTPEEQVPTERYRRGQRLKVYVLEVNRSPRGPEIIVSRSHKNLLKRLFELEVPEVYNGIVEIRSIAREAGSRSKVAVLAMQEGVDPVGSCIGMRGNRIQNIVNELQGEKIDVVRWDRDLKRFITNALSPAEVVYVEADEKESSAVVVVPERQLSLAIGKDGQNARLAAKLTGWHLDIKSMAEWEALRAQIKIEPEREVEVEVEVEAILETVEPGLAPIGVDPLEVELTVEMDVAETGETNGATPELDEPVSPLLEDALSDLISQEAAEETAVVVEDAPVLSLEEGFAALSFDQSAQFEEEKPVEVLHLTPDAGKIRFAEDILEEYRGPARTRKGGAKAGNRGKRGAKARKR
ncbi:transcription termination/antitermination protein NusA [SAR202 cluster bacterium AD-804-J14_MRT_500m]|nr:transcription termination/antitermination protein NusA [SAR202 cluster bacterium AD-804-J14_MRT_500m]MQF69608.1 transcription termination/antitermination protein NusA [SAR202 cluster bacterium AD-804-J14_MRT_500m]